MKKNKYEEDKEGNTPSKIGSFVPDSEFQMTQPQRIRENTCFENEESSEDINHQE